MTYFDDEISNIPVSLCVRCKGAKLLCGKSTCPIVSKVYLSKSLPLKVRDVSGSSPPSIFIGHYGYPKVRIGPAVPPVKGDTGVYESPDRWIGMTVNEIAKMRFSLYRGYKVLPVVKAADPNSYLSEIHDLILSSKPVHTELEYFSIDRKIDISPESQPFGPGGYVREFHHESSSSIPSIERMYYDTDIKATDAVLNLYPDASIYWIEKVFSAGMLGNGRRRKIVPTRWSITAVDKIISDSLISKVSCYDDVDGILTFHFRNIGNEYYVMIFPGEYSFEMLEIWNNGSIWTGPREGIAEGDYEKLGRMVINPKIGGSFFAAKVAVLEYLNRKKRKGNIVIVRFIDNDYTLPLGVWQVRENMRSAMKNESYLDNVKQFFGLIELRRNIDLSGKSKTFQIFKQQKKITDYG